MTSSIAPEAQDEIDNALTHARDPDGLRAAIEDALAAVGANPQIAAKLGRSRVRQYLIDGFPYSLVYTDSASEVRVIAFPHHKQRPGYWKNRLPKKP